MLKYVYKFYTFALTDSECMNKYCYALLLDRYLLRSSQLPQEEGRKWQRT